MDDHASPASPHPPIVTGVNQPGVPRPVRSGRRWLLAGVAAVVLSACTGGSGDVAQPTPAASTGAGSSVSAEPSTVATPERTGGAATRGPDQETLWLCRPGLDDNPCEGGLDSTTIERDGDRELEPFVPAQDPVADCFYVYPTVSEARRINAPLKVTEAEVRTVRAQAARFAETCRVFAPMYRQVTRLGLASGGLTDADARATAYQDVLSAFDEYLEKENDGRPFVLIGHSQGAFELIQLVQEQIDGDQALRSRMLSALLLGGNVTTRPGEPAHGTFVNVPACTSADQSGCVVAYSTYAGTPPATGLFGRSTDSRQGLCVSPAALLGRGDELTAYLPTAQIMGGEPMVSDSPDTGFVSLPGRVTGRCRSTDDFSWLDVAVDRSGLPEAPSLTEGRDPAWGLHTADVSIALGDLVDLVAAQSAAWAERGGAASTPIG